MQCAPDDACDSKSRQSALARTGESDAAQCRASAQQDAVVTARGNAADGDGPEQREQARVMIRYAGAKMLLRHPWLAIAHLIDGRREAPEKPRNKKS
jgi:hypothetical protein